jgi:hypothetical protein
VRGDLRLGGVFLEDREEIAGKAHSGPLLALIAPSMSPCRARDK